MESHVAPVTEWSLVHALPEQHPDIPSRYEMGCRKMQPRQDLCCFVPHLLALETARQDAAISAFCYIMYFPWLCESTRNNRGYTGFHLFLKTPVCQRGENALANGAPVCPADLPATFNSCIWLWRQRLSTIGRLWAGDAGMYGAFWLELKYM